MASNEQDNNGDLERVLNEGYLEEETAMDTDLSPESGQHTGERSLAVSAAGSGRRVNWLSLCKKRGAVAAARKPMCCCCFEESHRGALLSFSI